MSTATENNKRIAKNTLFLYARMLLIMAVTLYTSRVVLRVLGVEDFGIYNVVGGVVALLGFINSSMSISIQRFLSFEMGRKDYSQVTRIFSMAIQIHILIALVVIALLETFGLYFLRQEVVIPEGRMDAALVVFHFSVFACGFSILRVPFIALMIAYERMGIYAYVSVFEAFLKLLVAFLLGYFSYDSLSLYGELIFFSTLIVTGIYAIVSYFSFREIRYRKVSDIGLFKSLTQFASWSALGEMAWGFTLQGVNIVLNLFFGTIVNAAYAISSQVSSAVHQFVWSFQTAFNPQLIKTYAGGDTRGMMTLAYRGTKLSFYLLLFIALPLIVEMDFILRIWLGIVPEYASIFSRMVIINTLLDILSNLFATLAKAYGKIRNYQLTVSMVLFLNFPLSYIALKCGYAPSSVFVVYAIVSIILLILRCYLISEMFHVQVFLDYFRRVLVPISKVLVVSSFVPLWIGYSMEEGWFRLFLSFSVSFILISITVYIFGLESHERTLVKEQILRIRTHFFYI